MIEFIESLNIHHGFLARRQLQDQAEEEKKDSYDLRAWQEFESVEEGEGELKNTEMSFYLYLFISFVLVLKMMGICCDVVLCTGKWLKMLARTKIVTFINKGVIPAEGVIDAVEWKLFVP